MFQDKKMRVKGWCPSLEKPMESGDGLLVRIPIKFGRITANIVQKIAELSIKYGNGHIDLSNRGNLQLRGVSAKTYEPLRAELAQLGFERDDNISIIANPLDKKAQKLAEELSEICLAEQLCLPEKFLIVIDGGGVFPLFSLPCDLYINPASVDIQQIISILRNAKKCDKKPININTPPAPIGYIPLAEQSGVISVSAAFGRIEAEELKKLAVIAEKFSGGDIIFAPFRRVILPNIAAENSAEILQSLEKIGFITKNGDSRLNIHACVGAPACSSALGETRSLAQKWAEDHPNLTQTVHITGCSKGCAYAGIADITIDLSINSF